MGFINKLFRGKKSKALVTRKRTPEADELFLAALDRIENSGKSKRQIRKELERLATAYENSSESIIKGKHFGIHRVEPAHVAVVENMGVIRDGVSDSGMILGAPKATKLHQFDIRWQNFYVELNLVTIRKLQFKLNVTVLYKLDGKAAREMFMHFGDDYAEKLIKPLLIRASRILASKTTDEELLDPLFGDKLAKELMPEFETFGLDVKVVITEAKPSDMVTQKIEKVAELSYEAEIAGTAIEVFEVKARLAVMEVALRRNVQLVEANLGPLIEQMKGRVKNDLEKKEDNQTLLLKHI